MNSSYAIGAQILGAKESFAQVWWESRGDGKCFPRNWGVIWSLSEQCGLQSNCFGLTRGKSSSSDTNTWKVSGEVFKAGHINPAAGGFVLMSRAREQGWWKLGRVEVKSSRGERGREGVSKHLHSHQHPEGDIGVARKTARLQRSQVFCFTGNQGDFRIYFHGIGECDP